MALYWVSLLVTLLFQGVSSEDSSNNALCSLLQTTSIADRILTGHMTGWQCYGGEPDNEMCEDWSGVKCNRQGHVTYIDISNQNLTGMSTTFLAITVNLFLDHQELCPLYWGTCIN